MDGALVDNVYEHVLAWKMALAEEAIIISTWRIHRRIGMSGALLVRELARELGRAVAPDRVERVHRRHGEIFGSFGAVGRPLPGARELLAHLSQHHIAWAIATSGHAKNARAALAALEVDADDAAIVTRDQVQAAKPEPDLLLEAAARMTRSVEGALVVGDSVWDMLAAKRARSAGLGLLSGGYSDSELREAGAFRIFDDPADLLAHIEELAPQH